MESETRLIENMLVIPAATADENYVDAVVDALTVLAAVSERGRSFESLRQMILQLADELGNLKFHIVLHVSFVVAHLFLNITLLIPIHIITHAVVLHIESCI